MIVISKTLSWPQSYNIYIKKGYFPLPKFMLYEKKWQKCLQDKRKTYTFAPHLKEDVL